MGLGLSSTTRASSGFGDSATRRRWLDCHSTALYKFRSRDELFSFSDAVGGSRASRELRQTFEPACYVDVWSVRRTSGISGGRQREHCGGPPELTGVHVRYYNEPLTIPEDRLTRSRWRVLRGMFATETRHRRDHPTLNLRLVCGWGDLADPAPPHSKKKRGLGGRPDPRMAAAPSLALWSWCVLLAVAGGR